MSKKMLSLIVAVAILAVITLAVSVYGTALPYENVAAEALSDFDFKELEADYVHVGVYYEATDGFVAGTSMSTYDEVDFQEWSRDEWGRWIGSKAQASVGDRREVARVRSVYVFFSIGGICGESYKVEVVDVKNGGDFDRLIRYQPNLAEARLSHEQAERISGTATTVQLAKQIPEKSYSAVRSDLSECIDHGGVITFMINGCPIQFRLQCP